MVLHDAISFISFLVACRSFFSCFNLSLVSFNSVDDVGATGDVGNECDVADGVDGVDGRDEFDWIGCWSICWWFGEVGDTERELAMVAEPEMLLGDVLELL